MPENDEQDISAGEQAPAETPKEKFERERLSRRQALKRFGMTSAMATFALFSVDDLARMVGKAMQLRAGDNRVVEQIAKEFQQAGIALAAGTSGCDPTVPCQHCCNQVFNDGCYCSYEYHQYNNPSGQYDDAKYKSCMAVATENNNACVNCHCYNSSGQKVPCNVPYNTPCPTSVSPPQGWTG